MLLIIMRDNDFIIAEAVARHTAITRNDDKYIIHGAHFLVRRIFGRCV
jgi:hypothetical protein